MHAKAPSAPRGAGAKPQQHCPSCGAAVHDGMIICVQCGTNLLTGHKIAEERKAPPVRERRRWPLFVGFAVVVVALGVLVSQLPAFLKGPVDRARELVREGKDIEATNVLRQHLSAHADDPAAQFLFGQLRWSKQDYTEAAQAFQEAFRLDPANENAAWGALLAMQRQQGAASLDRQRALLQQLAERDPENAQAWYVLGLVRAEAGDLEGELQALRKAVALNPVDARVKFQLGIALARRGEYAAAREALDGAAGQKTDTEMQMALAAVESLSGASEEAAARMAALGGELADDAARVRVALGHIGRGEFAQGEEILGPLTQDVRRENALAAFYHAVCLQARGQKIEAAAKYMRVVDLNVPQAAEAATLAAALFLEQEDITRARQVMDSAMSLQRVGADQRRITAMMYTVQGRIFMAEGQPESALAAFQRAAEADPQYPGAALENGLYYIQTGMVSQGLAELRRYLQLVGEQTDTEVTEIALLVEQLQESERVTVPPGS